MRKARFTYWSLRKTKKKFPGGCGHQPLSHGSLREELQQSSEQGSMLQVTEGKSSKEMKDKISRH